MNPDLFLADVLSAPERLARTLDAYDGADTPLGQLPALPPFERVVFIGMGSSRFAALTASALLRSRGHRRLGRARVEPDADAALARHPRRRDLGLRGDAPRPSPRSSATRGRRPRSPSRTSRGARSRPQPTSCCRSAPGLSTVGSRASRSRQRSPCCTCSRGASAAMPTSASPGSVRRWSSLRPSGRRVGTGSPRSRRSWVAAS